MSSGNATPRDGKKTGSEEKTGNGKQQRTPRAGSESERSPRDGDESPRQRSPNKIYRAPPTPPPEQLYLKERSFTLDCVAVNTTSNDYARAKPKVGQIIPPYNSQKDKSVSPYFGFNGVQRTLKYSQQVYPGTSIEGPIMDRFYDKMTMRDGGYLSLRNKQGAGHSRETIDGHGQFMSAVQPIVGWNGAFGYRRTTPWLRREPSTFGVATNSPIYYEQIFQLRPAQTAR